MSVLRRNMFNGGGYAHRGTGITSGLTTPKRGYVDGPGSYAGTYEEYYDLLKGVQGERKPFSRLAAASPALLDLSGALLSGKSYQGGVGGALDILGQGLTASSPGFAKAIEARREYESEAATQDAALRMKALELSLDDGDYSDPTPVKIAYDNAPENSIDAWRIFDSNTGNPIFKTLEGAIIDPSKTPFKMVEAAKVIEGSIGPNVQYLDEDDKPFDGYTEWQNGRLVIKNMNDEIMSNARRIEDKIKPGDELYSVIDTATGNPTGEQLDLSKEEDHERYDEILQDTGFMAIKLGATLPDTQGLRLTATYTTDLTKQMNGNVLFIDELYPTYMMTLDENFILQKTIVGQAFRWMNNLKANIETAARAFIDGEGNAVFVDAGGVPLNISSNEFLARIREDSESRDILSKIAGVGEIFESRIIGLAYELAKSQNPDGRISEPDFRYALKQLRGATADVKVVRDVMQNIYSKSKNRYIQSWIDNHLSTPGAKLTFQMDGETTTARAEAEESWFGRSQYAKNWEKIIQGQTEETENNEKAVNNVIQGRSFDISNIRHNDISLWNSDENKLAEETLKNWLNSPHPRTGEAWWKFLEESGLVMTIPDPKNPNKSIPIKIKMKE